LGMCPTLSLQTSLWVQLSALGSSASGGTTCRRSQKKWPEVVLLFRRRLHPSYPAAKGGLLSSKKTGRENGPRSSGNLVQWRNLTRLKRQHAPSKPHGARAGKVTAGNQSIQDPDLVFEIKTMQSMLKGLESLLENAEQRLLGHEQKFDAVRKFLTIVLSEKLYELAVHGRSVVHKENVTESRGTDAPTLDENVEKDAETLSDTDL